MRHDVIIVGAGPAGSLCARHLARQGFSVLLLDKAAFPRPKICGDCLTPRVWSLWEQEDLTSPFQNLPHYLIQRFYLSCNRDSPLEVPLPPELPQHRAVCRTLLDHWLLQEAEKSGVKVLSNTTVERISGSHELLTSQGSFYGKILIGADGRNSFVARQHQLPPGPPACRRVAWQARIRGWKNNIPCTSI
ncbi:MAG: FAD-dependent oxidoreductase, partial [Blastochloris sp.]|nr:FAD-dependent oxidoreductase [Blastochloris sp.]